MKIIREALKLALAALEEAHYVIEHKQDANKREQAIAAVKEALAQPAVTEGHKQEPVATKTEKGITLHVGWDDLPADTPLYTSPNVAEPRPKREWVGLTEEEYQQIQRDYFQADQWRGIEAKLKELNHDN